ncbi:regulator of chromosome condensation 1/beta-lactamase-inhibitor protein II, partial [Baffinella frigidus]
MPCSGARAVGGTRVAPALALVLLAAWVGVAAGLPACPAVGAAVVSPCAPGCTVSALQTGDDHTCALFSHGGVRCWGFNSFGQLGLGNTDHIGDAAGEVASLVDVDLGSGRTAVQLAAGYGHTCAVLDDGNLKCWGWNYWGQLGLGNTQSWGKNANEMGARLLNVDLGSGWTVVEVAAGNYHTCARLENGAARALKCWGWNTNGQLGLGNKIDRGDVAGSMGSSLLAVPLGTGRSAVALALGAAHSCALLDGGSVKCWGRNSAGRLGLGDTEVRGDGGGEMGVSLPAVPL